ncbi:probable RNA-binding protein 18 [Porites lutea]|uniref:probable RNA-binding protein 18 n=1 Tax=Porites lutea TaxID=51062 RepID=UPI003CC53E91
MAADIDGKPAKDDTTNRKLWIGNLDKRLSEYNILKILQPYGEIQNLELLFHKSGVKEGEPRGYCFVEFKKLEQAENALRGLNGKLALSKPLVVDWAKKKTGLTGLKEQEEKNMPSSTASSKSSLKSCESKIRAIENKLKLMESGHENQQATPQGKHPLLVQSERTRTHPYKKQERYSRGRNSRTR